MSAIPCIVCKTPLENVFEDDTSVNQPHGGVSFQASGHYGSTVFDPMDRTYLTISVCDDCLVGSANEGLVRKGSRANVSETIEEKPWVPFNEEDEEWMEAAQMISCPYYKGTGSCASGCYQEPACQVNAPTEGWEEVLRRHGKEGLIS